MAKAAILEQTGSLTIGEVDLADPGPHEVLIDTKACGLCHSDLHFIEGTYPHPLPAIPGHEAAGVVRAVGSEVKTVKPGDHVVSCLSAFCGHCEFCVTGRMALCLGADTRRDQTRRRASRAMAGQTVAQMLNLSAFCEQMLIHEHACVAIDKDMPLDRAAVIGCAVTTGAGTIFNACSVDAGRDGGRGRLRRRRAGNDQCCEDRRRRQGHRHRPAARKARAGRDIGRDAFGRRHGRRCSRADHENHRWRCAITRSKRSGGRPARILRSSSLRRGGTATILGMMPLDCKVGPRRDGLAVGQEAAGRDHGDEPLPGRPARVWSISTCAACSIWTRSSPRRIPLEQINDGFEKMKSGHSARSVVVFD